MIIVILSTLLTFLTAVGAHKYYSDLSAYLGKTLNLLFKGYLLADWPDWNLHVIGQSNRCIFC